MPRPRPTLEDRLWTPEDLATRYGLSVRTLANWRALGIGPPVVHIGRRPRYPESGLVRWEASRA